MPRYLVTLIGRSRQDMHALVTRHHVTVLDHGSRLLQDGRFQVKAFVEEEGQVAALRAAGYEVVRQVDAEALGRQCQLEVGRGDRYRADAPNRYNTLDTPPKDTLDEA